jgi:hypothetical protein
VVLGFELRALCLSHTPRPYSLNCSNTVQKSKSLLRLKANSLVCESLQSQKHITVAQSKHFHSKWEEWGHRKKE